MKDIVVPEYNVVVPNSIYAQPAIVDGSKENEPHVRVLRFSRFVMPSRKKILDYVKKEIIGNGKFTQPEGHEDAQRFCDDIKNGNPYGERFIFRSHPMKDYSDGRNYLSLVDIVISTDEMTRINALLSDRRELSASDAMFQESRRFTGLDLRLDETSNPKGLILPTSSLVKALFDSKVRRSAVLNVRLDHDNYDEVRTLLSRVDSVVGGKFERIVDVSDNLLYSISSYLWNSALIKINGGPGLDSESGGGLLGFVISSPSGPSPKPSGLSGSHHNLIIPPDTSWN